MKIFLLLFIILLCFYFKEIKIDKFDSLTSVSYDISQGNSISWSNRINPKINIQSKIDVPFQVYQGTPIPLGYEDIISGAQIQGNVNVDSTKHKEQPMFFFNNYRCHSSCCITNPTYSCDTGCVCFDQGIDFKKQIKFDREFK